jgi:hypothetical protein
VIRDVAFFARAVAVGSVIFLACSSSSDGGGGPNGNDGGVGADGAATDGAGGDGALSDYDAGPPPVGSIPTPAPITYTCTRELHVATTGDDSNDGAVGTPFKTIAKGASVAIAGDCVKVHAGTYTEPTTVSFTADGAAGTPIVLVSADGRGAAIIDGSTNHAGPAIEVSHDYVVVDGFEIKNTPLEAGLHVVRFDGTNAGKCVGSILRNCKVTGGYSQLKIYQTTQGVLVENNEFYGASANVPLSLTGASGLVFRANYCHDWNSGDNGSAQLAGGSNGALFEKNLFQDVATLAGTLALGDGCGATCDNDPEHYAAVNARAIDNIFVRTVRSFDVLGCKNCSILSNTILDSGTSEIIKLGAATTNGVSHDTTGVRILDNIFSSPRSATGNVIAIFGAAGDGLQMDYNLFFNGPRGVTLGSTHPASADAHSVQGDPKLVSPTDLRPGAGSPAIGAGTNLVSDVPQDFLGVARPASGPFDIGALQH